MSEDIRSKGPESPIGGGELNAASGGQSPLGKAVAIMKGLPYEVDPYDICGKYICNSCGHTGTGPSSGKGCVYMAQFGGFMDEEEIHNCSTCKYFHGQPTAGGWLHPSCPPCFLLKLEGRHRQSGALFLGLAASAPGGPSACAACPGAGPRLCGSSPPEVPPR